MKMNVVFFSLRTKTCFSTTWTRKIESKMRTSENCLLCLTKLKFLTLNRSKYAGILASILPPSLKMFFDHLDNWAKTGIKNANQRNSGENVWQFRFGRQKSGTFFSFKSIKIRRNPCLLCLTKKMKFPTLNRLKYAGILASNPPSFFEDVFRPPGHEKWNQKCEFRWERVRFSRQKSGTLLP